MGFCRGKPLSFIFAVLVQLLLGCPSTAIIGSDDSIRALSEATNSCATACGDIVARCMEDVQCGYALTRWATGSKGGSKPLLHGPAADASKCMISSCENPTKHQLFPACVAKCTSTKIACKEDDTCNQAAACIDTIKTFTGSCSGSCLQACAPGSSDQFHHMVNACEGQCGIDHICRSKTSLISCTGDSNLCQWQSVCDMQRNAACRRWRSFSLCSRQSACIWDNEFGRCLQIENEVKCPEMADQCSTNSDCELQSRCVSAPLIGQYVARTQNCDRRCATPLANCAKDKSCTASLSCFWEAGGVECGDHCIHKCDAHHNPNFERAAACIASCETGVSCVDVDGSGEQQRTPLTSQLSKLSSLLPEICSYAWPLPSRPWHVVKNITCTWDLQENRCRLPASPAGTARCSASAGKCDSCCYDQMALCRQDKDTDPEYCLDQWKSCLFECSAMQRAELQVDDETETHSKYRIETPLFCRNANTSAPYYPSSTDQEIQTIKSFLTAVNLVGWPLDSISINNCSRCETEGQTLVIRRWTNGRPSPAMLDAETNVSFPIPFTHQTVICTTFESLLKKSAKQTAFLDGVYGVAVFVLVALGAGITFGLASRGSKRFANRPLRISLDFAHNPNRTNFRDFNKKTPPVAPFIKELYGEKYSLRNVAMEGAMVRKRITRKSSQFRNKKNKRLRSKGSKLRVISPRQQKRKSIRKSPSFQRSTASLSPRTSTSRSPSVAHTMIIVSPVGSKHAVLKSTDSSA